MSGNIQKILELKPCWPEIKNISELLSKKGFQTVVAGGAVRDALLGKTPKDIDLASAARPKDILKIFPRAKANFARYGVSLIPLKAKETLEIASFRKDSSYEDGRRPKSVSFSSMEEDARRRDFTVNALFYDPQKKSLIDLTGGLEDLKNKILRAVGPAKKRFEEDHLRALRALRLAHQLGFQIEGKTKKAIPLFAQKIKGLAKERLLDELGKMLCAGGMGTALKSLKEHGFFYSVFPALKGEAENRLLNSPFDFWDKNFSFSAAPGFCWAVLALPFFYNSAKGFNLFLKSLLVPSSDIKKALAYLKAVQDLTGRPASFAEKLKAFEGQKDQVFELARFWLESREPPDRLAEPARALKSALREFEKRQKGGKLPAPLVRGADLLARFPSVPQQSFSSILKKAFEYQMEKPRANKAKILKYAQTLASSKKQAPQTSARKGAKNANKKN